MVFELEPLHQPQPVVFATECVHLTDDGIKVLCGLPIDRGKCKFPAPNFNLDRDNSSLVSCERCSRARHGDARIHRLVG